MPLADKFKDKDLRALMNYYVGETARAGVERVQFTDGPRKGEKRFAAEVIEQGEAKLAGGEAHILKMEVGSTAGSQPASLTGRTTVELVLARTGFVHDVNEPGRSYTVPVLLVAGYANSSADFVAEEPAFRAFLSQIEIEGQRGFEAAAEMGGGAAASSSASPPPASSASPPPISSASPPPASSATH